MTANRRLAKDLLTIEVQSNLFKLLCTMWEVGEFFLFSENSKGRRVVWWSRLLHSIIMAAEKRQE